MDKEAQSAAPADWGIILINREIEKINLIYRTGYHVSCILLPLLHIDGSSAPSMIKAVGQERNNEYS